LEMATGTKILSSSLMIPFCDINKSHSSSRGMTVGRKLPAIQFCARMINMYLTMSNHSFGSSEVGMRQIKIVSRGGRKVGSFWKLLTNCM
jgi:hypothetical protein